MRISAHYKKEIKRKSLHLSSLWIPFLCFLLPKEKMVFLLTIVTTVVVIADIGRHYSLYLANLFYTIFGNLLRPHELTSKQVKLTGASYVMLASLLVVVLFHQLIAITALGVLMVSDSCAALVGRRYGKKLLVGEKTLLGTLAFILSGWGVVLVIGNLFPIGLSYFIVAGIAVCIGAIAELFAKKWHIDDNFIVPLAIGSFMWASWFLIGNL